MKDDGKDGRTHRESALKRHIDDTKDVVLALCSRKEFEKASQTSTQNLNLLRVQVAIMGQSKTF